jgi:hypothetical protein
MATLKQRARVAVAKLRASEECDVDTIAQLELEIGVLDQVRRLCTVRMFVCVCDVRGALQLQAQAAKHTQHTHNTHTCVHTPTRSRTKWKTVC